MQTEVFYQDQPVGTLQWTTDAFGARVTLDCAIPNSGSDILRCYAGRGAHTLRIGLPEPVDGRLWLERHLSRETLRVAGYLKTPPEHFYLAVYPEEKGVLLPGEPSENRRLNPALDGPQTGDAVLDALLANSEVQAEAAGDTIVLRCCFSPDKPFALAPAFVLCTVESGYAVLRWTKNDAAAEAASSVD
nr:hypothetical protein [uncultured Agathobaculum sp.]